MSEIDKLQRQNSVLTAALMRIAELTGEKFTVDMASIHETACDALAEDAPNDTTCIRAAGDVLFMGLRDNFVNVRGPILPGDYPHRPSIEVVIAGLVVLALNTVEDQDLDIGGAMAEIVARSNEVA